MKIAIGLAALLPAFAAANEVKPYVVYQGRAVRAGQTSRVATGSQGGASPQANTEAGRAVSAFGTGSIRPGVSVGRFSAFRSAATPSRAFRALSHPRGITGSSPATPSASNSAPGYAAPGARILSEGQQPVYSQAAGGGTHSVEGGGFIAMDQAKAHDVGRGPGISWAPPDTPPSASRVNSGGSGTGASANGPAPSSSGSSAPSAPSGSAGGGDNGGAPDNSTGFNPAF